MRNILFLTTFSALISCVESTMNTDQISYPNSRVVDQIDTLWGTDVHDPYRWLEDDRAPEVEKWVEDQNEVTREYLDAIPFRSELRERYEELFNYEKVGMPRVIGGRYFISKNDGLQNQSVVYVRESLYGEEKVYLDPNTLSENGTITAHLGGASKDGK